MKGNLVIISSPSGGGKGTLIREVLEKVPHLGYSVSYTTRSPRYGEQNGKHYYFVSKEEFEAYREKGGFLEYAEVHGNYYGTSLEEIRRITDSGSDVILEIGCGHGLAATLICEKLATGRLVAIDRSKKMIDASTRRNRKYVEAATAQFHLADVLSFDPGPLRFDKILAVRVGLFHRDAAAVVARARIQKWLKRGGKLFLVYDEP